MVNSGRLNEALTVACISPEKGIGTFKERTQHRVLKFYFEPDSSCHEISLGKYIADIYRDGHVYEIQTSGFGALVPKLEAFLCDYKVTVIYPCVTRKAIAWTDPGTGETVTNNKTTYKNNKYKVLPELIYIYRYLSCPEFSLRIVETDVTENRMLDGRGKDRKIKATKIDTIPCDILNIIDIDSREELMSFLEMKPGDEFLREDFSQRYKLRGLKLSAALKALTLAGIIEISGKQSRKYKYKVTETE